MCFFAPEMEESYGKQQLPRHGEDRHAAQALLPALHRLAHHLLPIQHRGPDLRRQRRRLSGQRGHGNHLPHHRGRLGPLPVLRRRRCGAPERIAGPRQDGATPPHGGQRSALLLPFRRGAHRNQLPLGRQPAAADRRDGGHPRHGAGLRLHHLRHDAPGDDPEHPGLHHPRGRQSPLRHGRDVCRYDHQHHRRPHRHLRPASGHPGAQPTPPSSASSSASCCAPPTCCAARPSACVGTACASHPHCCARS